MLLFLLKKEAIVPEAFFAEANCSSSRSLDETVMMVIEAGLTLYPSQEVRNNEFVGSWAGMSAVLHPIRRNHHQH